MKKHLYIPLALIILCGALTTGAVAQTAGAQRVLAKIPFAFTVGKTKLPAGKYAITVLNPTSDRKILQIRRTDGRASAMIMTTGVHGNASDNAKLVFERYDDEYYFSQAQMGGDTTTLAAVKTNSDRNGKALAATKKKIVVIAAG